MTNSNLHLQFSNEVTIALSTGKPVVALESTIITHGMPFPQNLETAIEVEQTVRDQGAVPATIAVQQGKILIGLSREQLESLAKTTDARKLSRADIAHAVVKKDTGSTTVAATMLCANLAGIKVFATGGLGGVHQGVTETWDISADLGEFRQSSTIVVCAGAKAILDVPKTLETLETLGIPVITYGSDIFPAFWSRDSGIISPMRLDNADQIARLYKIRHEIGQTEGIVVANPVPKSDELSREWLLPIIKNALDQAAQKNIGGKQMTPFLLHKIYELSEGKSLVTNIALVKNNAKLAAEIAKAL